MYWLWETDKYFGHFNNYAWLFNFLTKVFQRTGRNVNEASAVFGDRLNGQIKQSFRGERFVSRFSDLPNVFLAKQRLTDSDRKI